MIKNKAVDLFSGPELTIVEKMSAVRQSSDTPHQYLYQYAPMISVVLIPV